MKLVPPDLTCREVVELVTDDLEARLPEEARSCFELHLASCDGCRTYVQQMQQVLATIGRLTEESIRPDVKEALLRTFRTWKAGEGGGS